DGLLIPRVDRLRAQSMTAIPVSTLVYINNITTGSQTGTTVNVNAVDYYYFDGVAWVKLIQKNNIYNADGTLEVNRVVTQGANRLAFTGNGINMFSVNGGNFSIDAANNRVGIGTAAPTNKLNVVGAATTALTAGTGNTSAQLRLDGGTDSALDFGTFANPPYGAYIYSYNKTTANKMPLSLNPVIGVVGIGTSNPYSILSIVANNQGNLAGNDFAFDYYGNSSHASIILGSAAGTETAPGNLGTGVLIGGLLFKPRINGGWLYETASVKATYRGNGTDNLSDMYFSTSSAVRVLIDAAGNVGLGTYLPHNQLQLGNTIVNRKIVLNETVDNDHQYFGFGINGYTLRYQVDATTSDHAFYASNGSSTSTELLRIKGTGNVGIGTASPSQKLHVIGNILASGTITPSDIRIKKDVVDNTYGLREILGLRTINYRYKDEQMGKDKKLGFIAQEVKALIPELVTTANDDIKTLGVNYAEITVVLTKALKELQGMVKKQQEEIAELKMKLGAKRLQITNRLNFITRY
uniref:tail fiber domain-containing protein n=1 Tax=Pedobacter sp. UBA5917 TaxID=1947061 RepID=UPI0025F9C199